jgi:hypothetical protein
LGAPRWQPDPDHYEKMLVALRCARDRFRGGGPCRGACRGASGRAVVLADEDFELGGRCLAERRLVGVNPSRPGPRPPWPELRFIAEFA